MRDSDRRLAAMTSVLLAATAALAQTTAPAIDEALIARRSTAWADALKLDDAAKTSRVRDAIVTHLRAVHAWHDANPAATIDAATPALADAHAALMTSLARELSPEQVEVVLDQYTVGKVAFTLKGYEAIVPDLTAEERSTIVSNLKRAREQAIDQKSMKQISAVFGLAKDKCEQHLNDNGRNWRQLYKTFTDKIKAEKLAAATTTRASP